MSDPSEASLPPLPEGQESFQAAEHRRVSDAAIEDLAGGLRMLSANVVLLIERLPALDSKAEVNRVRSELALKEAQEAKRQGRLTLMAVAIVLVMLGGLLYNSFVTRSNAIAIRDCTEPTGVCYAGGVARTAAAVGILVGQEKATQRLVCLELTKQGVDITSLSDCQAAQK